MRIPCCQHGLEETHVPPAGISSSNIEKESVVVSKIHNWLYSWTKPGYVQDEYEYKISKHLFEKFVCSLPVWGCYCRYVDKIDSNTILLLSLIPCHWIGMMGRCQVI
jgi:hypothetical protein